MSETTTRPGAAVWFEIPVGDLDRAIRFYETVLARALRREVFNGTPMAIFPYADPGIGGALVAGPHHRPGLDGPLLYLNCDAGLNAALARVAEAGGEIAGPVVDLPPGMGRFAVVRDTEGNRVGLHEA